MYGMCFNDGIATQSRHNCDCLFLVLYIYWMLCFFIQLILRDGFIYSISFSGDKRVDNNLNKSNLNKNVKIDVDKKDGDDSDEGE